ncbi:uncharacterized protein LOC110975800 [Acanthaster planci]|uniref:Uncharacterized protein LOC110975800 n=1 Tax=Acanthaster planci TaxID=133434 RepID=A0A8B7XWT9_ACAPL|nr:uncharacterized protein LOC110975800 [Acanthaster planci]
MRHKMRSLILLVVFGTLLACSWAEKAKVEGAAANQQQHQKFRKEAVKKKVLADIVKVKISRAPENVKRKELKHIFDNLKRYEEKTSDTLSTSQAGKPLPQVPSKEEIVQAVERLEKRAQSFNKQQKGKMLPKAGTSLRRMSEETTKASTGQQRQRRAIPAKQVRTSFARAA